LKAPEGCAICESTWGNYWAEVEGQKMFFCCEICETEFRNMIEEVKHRTGWKTIDEVKIKGDQKGRDCAALSGKQTYRYFIRFNSRGEIETFKET
jgi:YHS domain-containing protein